jgi:transposase-like protein
MATNEEAAYILQLQETNQQLREKLRVAEECLVEYESREIDSGNPRGGIAAVALREIREVK